MKKHEEHNKKLTKEEKVYKKIRHIRRDINEGLRQYVIKFSQQPDFKSIFKVD